MSFIRQFLIYGVAGVASRLAAVVLVPLYTRMLSVGEYGQLEVLLSIHTLMVIVGGLQVESAVARDHLEAREAGDAAGLAWSALTLTLAGTLLVSAALLALARWGGPTLSIESISGRTLLLLLALTGPVQWLGVQMVMLRFGGNALQFALLSFSDLTLCALFSLVFIGYSKLGIDGALLGILCGKSICVALAWPRTLGRPKLSCISATWVRSMLRYGVPSLPAVLVNWLQNAGSRLLLALSLTLADVAVAGLAIKVAALYGFVVYSFRLAWEPHAMANLTRLTDDPQVFNRALEWYVMSMFLAAGLAVLAGPFVVSVLAPATYAPAGPVSAFFTLGQFWVGMTNVLVIGIHGARQTSRLLPVYALGVAINVVLLLGLAPVLGVTGAGIGFLVSSVCSALLAAYYSNRLFNTRFSVRLIGWTVLATAAMLLLWHPVQLVLDERASSAWASVSVLSGGVVLMLLLMLLLALLGLGRRRISELLAVLRRTIFNGRRAT